MLDQAIEAMNATLEAGDWSQVVALAPALRDHFISVGDTVQAELVNDLYAIACDALQHPLAETSMGVSG